MRCDDAAQPPPRRSFRRAIAAVAITCLAGLAWAPDAEAAPQVLGIGACPNFAVQWENSPAASNFATASCGTGGGAVACAAPRAQEVCDHFEAARQFYIDAGFDYPAFRISVTAWVGSDLEAEFTAFVATETPFTLPELIRDFSVDILAERYHDNSISDPDGTAPVMVHSDHAQTIPGAPWAGRWPASTVQQVVSPAPNTLAPAAPTLSGLGTPGRPAEVLYQAQWDRRSVRVSLLADGVLRPAALRVRMASTPASSLRTYAAAGRPEVSDIATIAEWEPPSPVNLWFERDPVGSAFDYWIPMGNVFAWEASVGMAASVNHPDIDVSVAYVAYEDTLWPDQTRYWRHADGEISLRGVPLDDIDNALSVMVQHEVLDCEWDDTCTGTDLDFDLALWAQRSVAGGPVWQQRNEASGLSFVASDNLGVWYPPADAIDVRIDSLRKRGTVDNLPGTPAINDGLVFQIGSEGVFTTIANGDVRNWGKVGGAIADFIVRGITDQYALSRKGHPARCDDGALGGWLSGRVAVTNQGARDAKGVGLDLVGCVGTTCRPAVLYPVHGDLTADNTAYYDYYFERPGSYTGFVLYTVHAEVNGGQTVPEAVYSNNEGVETRHL